MDPQSHSQVQDVLLTVNEVEPYTAAERIEQILEPLGYHREADGVDEAIKRFLRHDNDVTTLLELGFLFENQLPNPDFPDIQLADIKNLLAETQFQQVCVLDTRAYNTVIDGFFKSGKVSKAYQLLEGNEDKGHHPTVDTYGSVLDGLAKIDRLDEANYMLFEEAKLYIYKGLTPNVYTWNCLLDALVQAEEINEAPVCFQSMNDLKCTPNHVRLEMVFARLPLIVVG
ncbi:hypothetical protein Patl1_25062 [Pistacia atlantica]|uniref:Uncharacterized protein n=1 Tax=Pistacia atlantica TaxID=434234 RepID=A0ACC1B3K6_9ROSI|nr:hypothetical protein Patl1_25062 [Pistacia atlantica]